MSTRRVSGDDLQEFIAGVLERLGADEYSREHVSRGLTQTDALVVPTRGKRSFLGSNPICFTAPVEGDKPFSIFPTHFTIIRVSPPGMV